MSEERLAKLFGARPSVIHTDKPSLSACALGAGAAHAAVLALILPVMVTLPAPEDRAQGTVAIQVAVRSAPPSPFVQAAVAGPAILESALAGEFAGEGDADDAAWNELPPQEITGALPDIPEQAPLTEMPAALMEQAALSDPVAATPQVESAGTVMDPDAALVERAPELESEAEMELRSVASIESTAPVEPEAVAVAVPLPLRKPPMRAVERETIEVRPDPTPSRQAAAPARRTTARPAKPVFKGLFGGRPAKPMKEFPFPAGR